MTTYRDAQDAYYADSDRISGSVPYRVDDYGGGCVLRFYSFAVAGEEWSVAVCDQLGPQDFFPGRA